MKHIIIIGAGAAGLMALASILEGENHGDYHVSLFEKNTSPGKKIILSGGGRCNVTTSIDDRKILATRYVRGWDFIKKAIGKFSPKKCRDWFESHDVPLKIQEDYRVFPVSDNGKDIVGVFETLFAKNREKVSLHYGEGVIEVSMIEEIEEKERKKYNITTPKGSYEADILIITTGGNAYSQTGSTGDGYDFARSLGHRVTTLGPSLSSFLTGESWLHALSGLAFENAKISFYLLLGKADFREVQNDKMEQRVLTGPLLLTHFGISGPLAFMTSSHLAFSTILPQSPQSILFSPVASYDIHDWENFLKNQFLLHPKKLLTSILSERLPRRFAEGFVKEHFSCIEETFVGSISKKDREIIAQYLGEGIPLTLLERRPGDEFVTAGGVDTDELDGETFESKIHKNLYFAGEVINVDGYTGGFSLQICWSSGFSVGKAVSEVLRNSNQYKVNSPPRRR